MVSEELRRFYEDNPLVYGYASREDPKQLAAIYEIRYTLIVRGCWATGRPWSYPI